MGLHLEEGLVSTGQSHGDRKHNCDHQGWGEGQLALNGDGVSTSDGESRDGRWDHSQACECTRGL